MATHTRFKGISHIGDTLLSKALETNLISFCNWATLGIGGFFNVNIPTSGAYDGDFSRLRLVDDPNYSAGQVWEGARADWVWETGVEYDYQPIHASGVQVNGTFYLTATTTGTYAHHINYPLGRVVFDNAIPRTSVVKCEHSYRYVHYTHGSVPWWRQIQTNSMRVDDGHFLQQGSGSWDILSQNRIQLPAVIIESVPKTSRIPLQIGDSSAIVSQDALFHILAENPDDAKLLHDVITYQWDKYLMFFDPNLMFSTDRFPLDANGALASGATMYPDLIKPTGDGGCGWRPVRITKMQSVANDNPLDIWMTSVRGTFEVDLP